MNKQWNELKATITDLRDNYGTGTQREVCGFLVRLMNKLEKQMNSSEEPNKWIPFIKRPMTEEEREEYEERTGIEETMIFNCPLPEDGEQVFVSYGDYVTIETFYKEDGGVCYFDIGDIDKADAWMTLPAPFKPQESEEENG